MGVGWGLGGGWVGVGWGFGGGWAGVGWDLGLERLGSIL